MKFLACALLPLLSLGCLSSSSDGGRELERLYRELFHGYESDVRPVNEDGTPLDVKVGVAALCLDLTAEGILKSQLWLTWTWTDARLTAETDISDIRVNPAKLWKPDIALFNRADTWNPQFPEGTDMAKAIVYPATGQVLWVPTVYHEAHCDAGLDDFWGERNCTLKFGSWTSNGNVLDVDFLADQKEVDVSSYAANCPTEVVSSSAEKHVKRYPGSDDPYPSLHFNVTLRRRFTVVEHDLPKVIRNPETDDEVIV